MAFAPKLEIDERSGWVYCSRSFFCRPNRQGVTRTKTSREVNLSGWLSLGEHMWRLLGTLLVSALLVSHIAHACGDKLLVLGRPLRFDSRPAAILAFVPTASPLESLLSKPQWVAAMERGRHRLRVVQNPEQLANALKSERFDLVLADSTNAVALRSQFATSLSAAVLVPMVDSASRDALRTAQKEYGVAMKSPAKTGDYLFAIGVAVDLHDRRVEAASREKKNKGKSS
jgi:hypothetical protein